MNYGLRRLEELPLSLRLIREITGRRRNRRFRYESYLQLFERQSLMTEASDTGELTQTTVSKTAADDKPKSKRDGKQ
jgi:hypothetical protein